MRAIDLFASAGGMSLGMHQAGIKTVCAVEIDPCRIATYCRHNRTAEVLASDIRDLDLSTYRNKVEVIVGGPPCQPFSSGGLRRASADHRDMLPTFVKALGEVKPIAFV